MLEVVEQQQVTITDQQQITMLSSIGARIRLYSIIIAKMAVWTVQQGVGCLSGKQHPLGWSAEQDFNVMVLKALFTSGTYVHWRNFTKIWRWINGEQEQKGMVLEKVPADTFEVPGCRSSWWMSLEPALLKDAPQPKASCVIMYLHGEHLTGCFVCGCKLRTCSGQIAGPLRAEQLHQGHTSISYASRDASPNPCRALPYLTLPYPQAAPSWLVNRACIARRSSSGCRSWQHRASTQGCCQWGTPWHRSTHTQQGCWLAQQHTAGLCSSWMWRAGMTTSFWVRTRLWTHA